MYTDSFLVSTAAIIANRQRILHFFLFKLIFAILNKWLKRVFFHTNYR